jgi:hypothetical protein
MLLLSLLGVAAQAEGLRLRRTAGTTARRGAWLVAAVMFGVAAIGLAHGAAVVGWLAILLGAPHTTDTVAFMDVRPPAGPTSTLAGLIPGGTSPLWMRSCRAC